MKKIGTGVTYPNANVNKKGKTLGSSAGPRMITDGADLKKGYKVLAKKGPSDTPNANANSHNR